MLRHPLFSDDASLSFHDDISLPWIWSFYPVIFLKFHEFAFGFLHHLALHEQAAFAAWLGFIWFPCAEGPVSFVIRFRRRLRSLLSVLEVDGFSQFFGSILSYQFLNLLAFCIW